MPPQGNKIGAETLARRAGVAEGLIDQRKDSVQQARQVTWQPLPPGLTDLRRRSRDGRSPPAGGPTGVRVRPRHPELVARLVDETLGGAAHRALVESVAFSPTAGRLGGFRQVKTRGETTRRPDCGADAPGGRPGDLEDARRLCACGHAPRPGRRERQVARHSARPARRPRCCWVSADATRGAVYSADGPLALFSLAEGKRPAARRPSPAAPT
ncbi:MAG: hypothetical protein WKF75_03405 [Singulisphaera sp.]